MLKSIKAVGCVCVAVILVVGCSNVKNKKLTGDNTDQIIEQIKNSHDLTGGMSS